MNGLSWLVVLVSAFSSFACFKAAVAAKRRKEAEGNSSKALVTYWWTGFGYTTSFAALQLFFLLDWGFQVPLYAVATVLGASSLVSLLYILFRILYGARVARLAAEGGAMAAFVTLFFFFFYGIQNPHFDEWGVAFLPESLVARFLGACFYLATPLVLAATVVYTTKDEDWFFRKRVLMFMISVLLFYLPNAYRYTTLTTGWLGFALTMTTAIGLAIGWQSYNVKVPEHVEND